MKFNFKKISAVFAGALMAGMAMGGAVSAANYPSPFQDNVANTAVVYGSDALSSDESVANSIQADLAEFAEESGSSVDIDGESFKLEKSSLNFNYGDALDAIYPSLDEEELEEALAEGTYDDGNIDTDYEQELGLKDNADLRIFSDRDYNDEEPTLGFHWTSGEAVMSYSIEFDDGANVSEMDDTDLPLFGEEYYVLDADSTKIELLDSSASASMRYDETATIGDKEVTATFISDKGAKLSVDGETTKQLDEGDYEELSDGTYVAVTEVLASSQESMDSSVEVSIGSGKSILEDGEEVEMNEEDVDGLEVSLDVNSDDELDELTLDWSADSDELFLTEENPVTMPGFEKFSLVFGGLNYPDESETISVDSGQQLNINMDNYNLEAMYFNDSSKEANLGTEHETIVTENSNYTYDSAGYNESSDVWWGASFTENSTNLTEDALALDEDSRFLVTQLDRSSSDVGTLHYEVDSIKDVEDHEDGEFEVVLSDLIGSDEMTFTEIDEVNEEDDIEVKLVGFSEDDSTAYFEFSPVNTDSDYPLAYDRAVSEKGMVLNLPTNLAGTINDGSGPAGITFIEADDRGDVGEGESFTIDITNSSNDELHVDDIDDAIDTEEHSEDVYEGYMDSDLASKVVFDKSDDENDFEVEYFGNEATADVSVAASESVTTTEGEETGAMLVTDSEMDDVDDMNLIVVGGSCVNTAAADLLGVEYQTCGEDFTEATGVGSGEALIKGYSDSDLTSEHAVLVAGYSADDTNNAAKYLMNEDVDTSEEYTVSSATEATMTSSE